MLSTRFSRLISHSLRSSPVTPLASLQIAVPQVSASSTLLSFKRQFSTSEETTTSALGLESLGIQTDAKVFRNLTYEDIAAHEKAGNEGIFVNNGTLNVDTGKFTGRSPKDKYIVSQSPSKDNIWWGDINQPMNPETFDELYSKVTDYYNNSADKLYVFDGYCGASDASKKNVRIITNLAWQHHFVKNMFIRPKTKEEVEGFKPDYTIINACKVVNDNYKDQGLNSDVFVAFNIEKEVAIIGGTWYGGEMKKGIFSMMNYWLPNENVMPMHCSANKGKDGDTALFFGLSGTGKTTLSADPERALIGDDEHGWDDTGIFNFEGGCYAKVINLKEENEPDIYNAIKPNALLENVVVDKNNDADYFDGSKTANTRVSYPLEHIKNFEPTSTGGHPKNIVFLTFDAYGVLPPVSKLNPGQAMYHFLSGYTAKVAGTERGVTEPVSTFSACFGAAFLPLHPTKYADLLQKKIEEHGSNVYLVNTGNTGSPQNGYRMPLSWTREVISKILDGSIEESTFVTDDVFGFDVPESLGSIPTERLIPNRAWENEEEYNEAAKKLASQFINNFETYISPGFTDYSPYGPRI